MAGSFVPPPSYPTPNYDALGQTLGNLPADYQRAQLLRLAQEQQQNELDQQRRMQTAFQGGLPMQNGQLDTNQYMQTLAKQGLLPPNEAAQLSRVGMEQQQYAPAPADQFLGGSAQPAGDQLSRLEAGVAKVESGGQKDPYRAIGPETKSGDKAYGKYQVMGANIPAWTDEVLGRKMTPNEFLNDPQAQEAVARSKLGQYLKQYGDAPDAASKWFTGKPLAQGANKTDVNGMSGARYAAAATGSVNDAAPSVPPVSAAAGSSIPRSNGGAPSAPVGQQPGGGAQPGLAGQTVASLAQGLTPNQQANLAKAVGAKNANAPLSPDQTKRAQSIIEKNASLRAGAGQQAAQPGLGGQLGAGGPAGAPGGSPLVYQPPLDRGFKTQEEEITAEAQQIARLRNSPSKAAQRRADDLEKDREDRIKAISPMVAHPGTQVISPTGETLFEAPTAGERTLAERKDEAHEIAQGIKSGTIPPTAATGYGVGPLVRAELARGGDYNLTKANLEYDAAKKQVMSLNGPQMVRFNALAESVVNTIDRTIETSKELNLSGIPLANKVELGAWMQTNGNSPKGQKVAKYLTDVSTLKEEYANLANGGYAPTESAWKLSNMVINGDYGSKQFEASLEEAQRLINFRRAAFSDLSTMGPGAPNPYMPGRGPGGVPQPGGEKSGGKPAVGAIEIAPGWTYKGSK